MAYVKKYMLAVNNNLNCPPHVNAELEVIIVTKGTFKVRYETEALELYAGESALVMPFGLHSFTVSEDCEAYVLLFDNFLAEEFYMANMNYEAVKFSLSKETLSYVFSHINATSIYTVKSVYYAIISEYVEAAEKGRNTANNDRRLIKEITGYIYDHMNEHISLDDLAKSLCVNKGSISRVFKKNIGVSMSEFVSNIRLEKAVLLLLWSGKSVTEIAYECGFGSIRNFNRVFKTKFFCTPSEYKEQYMS